MPRPDYDNAMNLLRIQKRTDAFLYYYTSDTTFFKMLDNLRIKTSRFNAVNDLDEANLDCLGGYWIKKPKIREFVNNKCRFVSFVHDEPFIEGTSHPRMWSQYANDNKGVCLVLNREKLLDTCKKQYGKDSYKIGDIQYVYSKYALKKDEREIEANCKLLDVEQIIRQYHHELLFTKHIDWEHEYETRLLFFNEVQWLPIDGCIEGICLGRKFIEDKSNIVQLIEIIKNDNYKYKGYITKDCFGLVAVVEDGYTCESIRQTFHIEKVLGKTVNELERRIKTLQEFQKA